jgi:replication factor C subunit 3/5
MSHFSNEFFNENTKESNERRGRAGDPGFPATDSIPWVEKYRPTQFDDIVLDPINRRLFKNILGKKYFPNLLFYGPPGTGKTTTIINLINEFQTRYSRPNKSNIIHLNASDERGIDIIRNQIFSFVKSLNLFETGLKFVVLDEVDYMTKNAQQALKLLLQTSSNNVRYCLICNYISKIDESLQNEFMCIRFNQLPKTDIYAFMRNIATKENLNINEKTIDTIMAMYQSDIRSMINFIQLNQNFHSDDWNSNVMNRELLEKLHEVIHVNGSLAEVVHFIHNVSVRYNMDKKHIIQHYFNYVIRYRSDLLNLEFLNIVKETIHNTSANLDTVIYYFVTQLRRSH